MNKPRIKIAWRRVRTHQQENIYQKKIYQQKLLEMKSKEFRLKADMRSQANDEAIDDAVEAEEHEKREKALQQATQDLKNIANSTDPEAMKDIQAKLKLKQDLLHEHLHAEAKKELNLEAHQERQEALLQADEDLKAEANLMGSEKMKDFEAKLKLKQDLLRDHLHEEAKTENTLMENKEREMAISEVDKSLMVIANVADGEKMKDFEEKLKLKEDLLHDHLHAEAKKTSEMEKHKKRTQAIIQADDDLKSEVSQMGTEKMKTFESKLSKKDELLREHLLAEAKKKEAKDTKRKDNETFKKLNENLKEISKLSDAEEVNNFESKLAHRDHLVQENVLAEKNLKKSQEEHESREEALVQVDEDLMEATDLLGSDKKQDFHAKLKRKEELLQAHIKAEASADNDPEESENRKKELIEAHEDLKVASNLMGTHKMVLFEAKLSQKEEILQTHILAKADTKNKNEKNKTLKEKLKNIDDELKSAANVVGTTETHEFGAMLKQRSKLLENRINDEISKPGDSEEIRKRKEELIQTHMDIKTCSNLIGSDKMKDFENTLQEKDTLLEDLVKAKKANEHYVKVKMKCKKLLNQSEKELKEATSFLDDENLEIFEAKQKHKEKLLLEHLEAKGSNDNDPVENQNRNKELLQIHQDLTNVVNSAGTDKEMLEAKLFQNDEMFQKLALIQIKLKNNEEDQRKIRDDLNQINTKLSEVTNEMNENEKKLFEETLKLKEDLLTAHTKKDVKEIYDRKEALDKVDEDLKDATNFMRPEKKKVFEEKLKQKEELVQAHIQASAKIQKDLEIHEKRKEDLLQIDNDLKHASNLMGSHKMKQFESKLKQKEKLIQARVQAEVDQKKDLAVHEKRKEALIKADNDLKTSANLMSPDKVKDFEEKLKRKEKLLQEHVKAKVEKAREDDIHEKRKNAIIQADKDLKDATADALSPEKIREFEHKLKRKEDILNAHVKAKAKKKNSVAKNKQRKDKIQKSQESLKAATKLDDPEKIKEFEGILRKKEKLLRAYVKAEAKPMTKTNIAEQNKRKEALFQANQDMKHLANFTEPEHVKDFEDEMEVHEAIFLSDRPSKEKPERNNSILLKPRKQGVASKGSRSKDSSRSPFAKDRKSIKVGTRHWGPLPPTVPATKLSQRSLSKESPNISTGEWLRNDKTNAERSSLPELHSALRLAKEALLGTEKELGEMQNKLGSDTSHRSPRRDIIEPIKLSKRKPKSADIRKQRVQDTIPKQNLYMQWCHGITSGDIAPLASGELVYGVASTQILLGRESNDNEKIVQRFFQSGVGKVTSLATHPNGFIVASGHAVPVNPRLTEIGSHIVIWDSGTSNNQGVGLLSEPVQLQKLKYHVDQVTCLNFSPDGNLLITGGVRGDIALWRWRTGEMLSALSYPSTGRTSPDTGSYASIFQEVIDLSLSSDLFSVLSPESIDVVGIIKGSDDHTEMARRARKSKSKDSGNAKLIFWRAAKRASPIIPGESSISTILNDNADANADANAAEMNQAMGRLSEDTGTSWSFRSVEEIPNHLDKTYEGKDQMSGGSSPSQKNKQKQILSMMRSTSTTQLPTDTLCFAVIHSNEANNDEQRRTMSRDISIVVSGTSDGALDIWLPFSAGRLLVTKLLRMNAAHDGHAVQTVCAYHSGSASGISDIEDASLILSGGRDGTLKLWSIHYVQAKAVNAFLPETSWQHSPEVRLLPMWSISPWKNHKLSNIPRLTTQIGSPSIFTTRLRLDCNNKVLAVTNLNSVVYIDVSRGTPGNSKDIVKGHRGAACAIAAHPTKPVFLTAGKDCQAILWDADTTTAVASISIPSAGLSASFNPSGKSIVVGMSNGAIAILELTLINWEESSWKLSIHETISLYQKTDTGNKESSTTELVLSSKQILALRVMLSKTLNYQLGKPDNGMGKMSPGEFKKSTANFQEFSDTIRTLKISPLPTRAQMQQVFEAIDTKNKRSIIWAQLSPTYKAPTKPVVIKTVPNVQKKKASPKNYFKKKFKRKRGTKKVATKKTPIPLNLTERMQYDMLAQQLEHDEKAAAHAALDQNRKEVKRIKGLMRPKLKKFNKLNRRKLLHEEQQKQAKINKKEKEIRKQAAQLLANRKAHLANKRRLKEAKLLKQNKSKNNPFQMKELAAPVVPAKNVTLNLVKGWESSARGNVKSANQKRLDAIKNVSYSPNGGLLAIFSGCIIRVLDVLGGYKQIQVKRLNDLEASLKASWHSSVIGSENMMVDEPKHTVPVLSMDWDEDGVVLRSEDVNGNIIYWQICKKNLLVPNVSHRCHCCNTTMNTNNNMNPKTLFDLHWVNYCCAHDLAVKGIWRSAAVGGPLPDPRVSSVDVNLAALCRSPCGRFLLAGDDTAMIRMYRFPVALPLCRYRDFAGHSDMIESIIFLCDGSVVSVGRSDGAIIQWNISDIQKKNANFDLKPKNAWSDVDDNNNNNVCIDIVESIYTTPDALAAAIFPIWWSCPVVDDGDVGLDEEKTGKK